jgi:hypothetical protein
LKIDRRHFVAGIGALGLTPSVVWGASGAADDPTQVDTAVECLSALGGQIASAGAGSLLSWAGTQAFNAMFGRSSDPIAAELDKILAVEQQILSKLYDVETEVDWEGALTRIQPAVSTITAFFQSAKDNVDPPRPIPALALQLQILKQDTTGVKSALTVIHEELVGKNPAAPGTTGLLQLWRDKNWSKYIQKDNVDPYSFVNSVHNYLRAVYLLQMKGLTLYVSAALASNDPATQRLALTTAKMVYDNMSQQSDLLYDAVGHASDLFNDYAPRPAFTVNIDPRLLVPGFELTTVLDGVTFLLGSHKGLSGDDEGITSGYPENDFKNPKNDFFRGFSTEWFLRDSNQLTSYPLLQRITALRDNKTLREIDVQVRPVPGSENAIEIAEWNTTLGAEQFGLINSPNGGPKRSQFTMRPTGNYFFVLVPFGNRVNDPPARCL